ncbi:GIY-YIG nuclease family protein [Patescibacteria group bacterium]|nr:GIY-YIG nuclease family protein [Patescibacteria group bacterium]
MFRKIYTVYIVECSDRSLYTGITNNIERRLDEHNLGISEKSYTYSRRPVRLVYAEEHYYVNDAIAREKQIKGWSRRKKVALIEGNIERLKELSNGASAGSA